MQFKETYDWAVSKFKNYTVYSQYDSKVDFGNAVFKVGIDEVRIFGCNDIVKGTINRRNIKDVKRELREFYDAKHN